MSGPLILSTPIKIAMVATFIAIVVAIRLILAPAIYDAAGWIGCAFVVLGCLAIAKWLEG